MIFFPAGLYNGERLSLCSDEARLHFPYVAGLVNSLGRMQLSIPQILERAYQSFQNKPTKQQLTAWITEYRSAFLMYVYTSAEGEVWGQLCGVPDNALPRYQTAADRKSPAPRPDDIAAFDAEYSASKRQRAEASEDFVNLSETFGNLPKCSEVFESFQNVSAGEDVVEDVDVDVDEEEKQQPLSSFFPAEGVLPKKSKQARPKDLEAEEIVRHVFAHYLQSLGRSERQYRLTPDRMKKGLAALKECRQRFPTGTKAEEAMGAAVDGLLADRWMMGENERRTSYTDWIDHIFKDVETMEKRWLKGGFKADV